jgi:cell cycle arrest protein BUB2
VLAAPFLYSMSEVDAFFSFHSFIKNTCPLYVQSSCEGVHCGLKLMDTCLQIIDPELSRFLKSKDLSAEVYAFPSVMTFSACTAPISEVLKLWDFYLACMHSPLMQ